MAFDVSTFSNISLDMLASISTQSTLVLDRIIILDDVVTAGDIETQPLEWFEEHAANISERVDRSFLSAGRVADEGTARVVVSLQANGQAGGDVSAKTIIITAHVIEAGQTVIEEAPFYGISDADGLTLPAAAVVPLSFSLAIEFGFTRGASVTVSGQTVENFLLSSEAARFVSAHSVASSGTGDAQIVRGVKTFADAPKVQKLDFFGGEGVREDFYIERNTASDDLKFCGALDESGQQYKGRFCFGDYNYDFEILTVDTSAEKMGVYFCDGWIKVARDEDHDFPSFSFMRGDAEAVRTSWNMDDDKLDVYYIDRDGEAELFVELGQIGTNGKGINFAQKVTCEGNLFARGLGADTVDTDALDTHTDGATEIKIARSLVPDYSVYSGDVDIDLGTSTTRFKNGYFDTLVSRDCRLGDVTCDAVGTPLSKTTSRRTELAFYTGAIIPGSEGAQLGKSSTPWRGYFSGIDAETINGTRFPAYPNPGENLPPVGSIVLGIINIIDKDSTYANGISVGTVILAPAIDSGGFRLAFARYDLLNDEWELGRLITRGSWTALSETDRYDSGILAPILLMRVV